ncbi:MAG: hypothetical protein ACI86H_002405 [bacterium]|jgi:hypothetical protein
MKQEKTKQKLSKKKLNALQQKLKTQAQENKKKLGSATENKFKYIKKAIKKFDLDEHINFQIEMYYLIKDEEFIDLTLDAIDVSFIPQESLFEHSEKMMSVLRKALLKKVQSQPLYDHVSLDDLPKGIVMRVYLTDVDNPQEVVNTTYHF